MSNKKCKRVVELLSSENFLLELEKRNISIEELTFDVEITDFLSYMRKEINNKRLSIEKLFLMAKNETVFSEYMSMDLFLNYDLEKISMESFSDLFVGTTWDKKEKMNVFYSLMSLMVETIEDDSFSCEHTSALKYEVEESFFEIFVEINQTDDLEMKKEIIRFCNEFLNKEIKAESIRFILKLYKDFGLEKIKGFEKEVWGSLHPDLKYITANIVDILSTKEKDKEAFKEIEALKKNLTNPSLLTDECEYNSLNKIIYDNQYNFLSIYFYVKDKVNVNDYKIKINDHYDSLVYIIKELLFLNSDREDALSLKYPSLSKEIINKLLDLKNKNQKLFNDNLFSFESFSNYEAQIKEEPDVLSVLYNVNNKTYIKVIKTLLDEGVLEDFIFRSIDGKMKKRDLFNIDEINPQDLTEETKEYLKNKNINLHTVVDYINKDFKYKIKDFNESEDIYFKIEKEEIDLIELKFAN
jgi:hypothetical protein